MFYSDIVVSFKAPHV